MCGLLLSTPRGTLCECSCAWETGKTGLVSTVLRDTPHGQQLYSIRQTTRTWTSAVNRHRLERNTQPSTPSEDLIRSGYGDRIAAGVQALRWDVFWDESKLVHLLISCVCILFNNFFCSATIVRLILDIIYVQVKQTNYMSGDHFNHFYCSATIVRRILDIIYETDKLYVWGIIGRMVQHV